MTAEPLFTASSTLMDLMAHVRKQDQGQVATDTNRAVTIRVLANFSTQYLVTALQASLIHRGVLASIEETAYDQWEFVLNSPAAQAPADYTIILLSTSKLVVTPRASDPGDFADYLLELVRGYQAVVGGKVIVAIPESLREGVDQSLVFHTWVHDLRRSVTERLSKSCVMFDLDVLAREFGFERWSAPKYYLSSKLPCHPNCFPALGAAIGDLIWSHQLRPTRLVIVDLDNTLWAGEVGEVGWQGVGLDPAESGYSHLLLQRMLLDLKRNGVLLAIASKNEMVTALDVIRNRPEMILSVDDFSAIEINWRPKSQNVEAILTRLNLTAVGVAFLDDSRLERAEIRARVPGVLVPELPDATEDWVRFLAASKMFSLGAVREEDRNRAAMYETEARREKLAEELGSYEDFLRELQLVVTPEPLGPSNRSRAHELVQKTNQFNLTGNRSTETDLDGMAASDQFKAFVYRLSDRYGSYGIISVVILERESADWKIHTWVMSCRAMGRQVERAVFDHVISELTPHDGYLLGEFIASGKNDVLSDFLSNLGFSADPGSSLMRLRLADLKGDRPPTVVRIERATTPT